MAFPNFTLVSDDPRPASGGNGSEGDRTSARKNKPQRPLPSDRLKVGKQLDLLKAYAIGSEFGVKPTTYIKAAALANLGPNSVSLCNSFFNEMGLLSRAEGGIVPTQPVIEYARACEWGRDDAALKLAPAFQAAWFARTLTMYLQMRPLSFTDAIQKLAEEAAAGPEFQAALRMCIEYLEHVGIVRRNGEMLQLCGTAEASSTVDPDPLPPEEQEMPAESMPKERVARPSSGPIFPQANGGAIRLAFDVTVTMAEMATWEPERITRFFAGVAQVLSAKQGTDPVNG